MPKFNIYKPKKKTKHKFCANPECKKSFKPFTSLDKYCCVQCKLDHLGKPVFKPVEVKIDFEALKKKKEEQKKEKKKRNKKSTSEKFGTSSEYNKFQRNKYEIRDNMKEERGFVYCERCDSSIGKPRWETHHIIFRSEKPGHKNLNDKINLWNLCVPCHELLHKYKWLRNSIVLLRKLHLIFGNDVLDKENKENNGSKKEKINTES